MNELSNCLSGLHAHLDENPSDWQARRELADLLEDLGRDREAYFQRWLIANKVAPYVSTLWYWGKYKGEFSLGAGNEDALIRQNEHGLYGRRTRQDAESCLLSSLEEINYELPYPLSKRKRGKKDE